MTLRIRPAERRDLEALAALVGALAAHHGDAAAVTPDGLARDVLGPDAWFRTLVAEEGGTLPGYASLLRVGQLQFGARGVELHHLHVAEAARGRGLGRRLVEAAVAEAQTMGAAFLVVGAAPENAAAHGFYEAMGFERRAGGSVRFAMRLAPPP